MIHLTQAIIVEGKYDKIKLETIVDALIITTEGFSIFKDKEKKELIKALAKSVGIIILTDSDSAGFKIRNYIKNFVKDGKIYNVYVPDIFGKEKRKISPSKEGKLGVEGISPEIISNAIRAAGIDAQECDREEIITRVTLFDDGFIGQANSEQKRRQLLHELKLPEAMSVNSLLEVINKLYTVTEYKAAVEKIK